MFRRALISVADKSGLIELVSFLVGEGTEIVSSGGTADHLRKANLAVTDVSAVTGFPEVLNGRVKTLHPRIHMGILADPDDQQHLSDLQKHNIKVFDLVVVNLYPFARGVAEQVNEKALIELIDVGGPTMLRAAAKNFSKVCVLSDPIDYSRVTAGEQIGLAERRQLAARTFHRLAAYDALIADSLGDAGEAAEVFVEHQQLRYGENPQQKGRWQKKSNAKTGWHTARQVQGKELSYNNLLDLDAAVRTLQYFERDAAQALGVAIKHTSPCGVVESQPNELISKLLTADPVSVFGGVIALSVPIDATMAQQLVGVFLEAVVAPEVTPQAQEHFTAKPNLRVIEWPQMLTDCESHQMRSIRGGRLMQNALRLDWKSVTTNLSRCDVDPALWPDVRFGLGVAASLKSNAIAIVADRQTLGLGSAQVNRIDAVAQAIERWRKFHSNVQQPILVSDGFFPFSDSVELIAKHGIRLVIEPGGSIRDEEIKVRAHELGVKLILTEQRLFAH